MNPYYTGRPTVLPSPNFDASSDSQLLYKAMKGIGMILVYNLIFRINKVGAFYDKFVKL